MNGRFPLIPCFFGTVKIPFSKSAIVVIEITVVRSDSDSDFDSGSGCFYSDCSGCSCSDYSADART